MIVVVKADTCDGGQAQDSCRAVKPCTCVVGRGCPGEMVVDSDRHPGWWSEPASSVDLQRRRTASTISVPILRVLITCIWVEFSDLICGGRQRAEGRGSHAAEGSGGQRIELGGRQEGDIGRAQGIDLRDRQAAVLRGASWRNSSWVVGQSRDLGGGDAARLGRGKRAELRW